MRGFTWIISEGPGVEHVIGRRCDGQPWQKGLKGSLEKPSGEDALVDLQRVAPCNGEAPGVRPVVADGLLEDARVVQFCSMKKVVYGISAVLGREDRIYGVQVVDGDERSFWVS